MKEVVIIPMNEEEILCLKRLINEQLHDGVGDKWQLEFKPDKFIVWRGTKGAVYNYGYVKGSKKG